LKRIIIASRNEGKIKEIKKIMDLPGVTFLTYRDLRSWPQIEESGQTFEENAVIKAKILMHKFGLPVVADDSGLEVDALKGAPGVLSSRFAGKEASDEENNQKLLAALKSVPQKKRTARFRCVAIYLEPSGRIIKAEGVLEGQIGYEKKGSSGFGYDPLFIPLGQKRTLAEIGLEEKNRISHRAQAFRKLSAELKQIFSQCKDC
jgi:XTP/dITP diphosphohydrolase